MAITYWLFANFAISPPKEPLNPTMVQLQTAMSTVRSNGLHRLQLYSGIALAIMTIVSVVLGWLLAGRVLAPLRTITATADRISETNLHQRLAMSGPRDELRLLADTIDRLLARLEASFDAQRRFVANASHELRTPLAMMRTTLDVAIAKPGVPAQSRELDVELRVDLGHADQLLESFLMLARAQNGQLEERDQVALEPLIRSAVSDRADQIAAKELTVEADLDAVDVAGSPTLLRRMIENVIENAVRHTKPGGLVEIALTSSAGRQARVVIASSGPVLDPGAVAQLTQPFKRLSHPSTSPNSSCASARSPAADPPPVATPFKQPALSLTRSPEPLPATDGRSNSPTRSVPCSKPCSKPARPHSAPSDCSSRLGTRTSTHSPTPSRSRSPGSDADSVSPTSSITPPASATGSLTRPNTRGSAASSPHA